MPELTSGYAGGGLVTASSFSGSDSLGSVTVTAGGSGHVKGTAVELIAATAHDANWIEISITNVSLAGAVGLVDILIGSSTEQIIIPDLCASFKSAGCDYAPYLFPVFIPKGSRVSARWQASTGLTTISCSVRLIGGTLLGGGSGPSMAAGYGSTTNSLGTNIDPGGTANTWSAWTEMTASTSRDHRWLVIAGRYGDGSLSLATNWRVQIGIGAATESILIPDISFSADGTSDNSYSPVRAYPVFIPKGSRLTIRARSSVTTDGDRDVWLRLYGAG